MTNKQAAQPDRDDAPTLASQIREGRERARLSLREAAALVGLHYSVLSRIETGDVLRPSPEIVQRLAEVLELDSTELLGFIGVREQVPAPQVYFRKAYNLSDEDAEKAARQVEAIIANLKANSRTKDKNEPVKGGEP